MKKIIIIFIGAMFLWPHLGWTIGRAGNGQSVVDSQLGFEAKIPQRFYGTQEFPDDSLRVFAAVFKAGVLREDYLHFVDLAAFFPDTSFLSREEANRLKVNKGGIAQTHFDPCLDIHIYESSTLIYGTAQWGMGKGIAIYSPLSAEAKQDVLSVLQSLKLDAGACEWT